jgi:hypothetical protein
MCTALPPCVRRTNTPCMQVLPDYCNISHCYFPSEGALFLLNKPFRSSETNSQSLYTCMMSGRHGTLDSYCEVVGYDTE